MKRENLPDTATSIGGRSMRHALRLLGVAGDPAPCADSDPVDMRLDRLAAAFNLAPLDLELLALALLPDRDAALIAPLADAVGNPALPRVSLHLAAQWLELGAGGAIQLATSRLWSWRWLDAAPEGWPLGQWPLRVPRTLALALLGNDAPPRGTNFVGAAFALPPAWLDAADAAAKALARPERAPQAFVLLHDDPDEARGWFARVSARLAHRTLRIDADFDDPALSPWLVLQRALVLVDAAANERERIVLPEWPGHGAPLLVLARPEQRLDAPGRERLWQRLPAVPAEERLVLWRAALGETYDDATARELAGTHRLSPGQIASIAAAARTTPTRCALAALPPPDLRGLATWQAPVNDAAARLVHPRSVALQLELLAARCRARESLPAKLGAVARTRLSHGVRALLYGPSGTGKTVACETLAGELGKPLLRIDPAAVTSKYLGETERHLDRLFAIAERSDAVLLFDEADALFARRTDVSTSNDRFANAQTNFLLQRLEVFDGIALLTSNSRARFDEAFTRRLDAIIEFTLPALGERLALIRVLFDHCVLEETDMTRLAMEFEASGGALRNVAMAAQLIARDAAPRWPQIAAAVALECTKTNRAAPVWAQQALAALRDARPG